MISYKDYLNITKRHLPSLFSEKDKYKAYKNISIHQVLADISFRGDWFQFGVYKGQTARILESFILSDQKLHLFDSFEGLPEAWSDTTFDKGHFKLNQANIPRFNPARTVIHKGWFSDTLPDFVASYTNPIPFIHFDADLYSSTMTVLEAMDHLIVPGTVLLFDEFFLPSPKGVSDEECRALTDWSDKKGRLYQILWRTEWAQCAVKILK